MPAIRPVSFHRMGRMMTSNPATPTQVEQIPSVAGGISAIASANAPVLYFEGAPFFGLRNGIGKITLEIVRQAAVNPAGGVVSDRVIVAYLVGSLPSIRALRTALDGILLLAEPTGEGPSN